jgi:NDP-sugar pyrophosphorylase family protein
MRAVVFVDPSIGSSDKTKRPSALIPCVDRPAVQHLVEALVEHGITRFDFVLDDSPEEIEGLLGDGKRWGSNFTFHMVRDSGRPYRVLHLLEGEDDILLVHADVLIDLGEAQITGAQSGRDLLFFCGDPAGYSFWSGWAQLTPEAAKAIPAQMDRETLGNYLADRLRKQVVSRWVSFRSFSDLLETQQRVLDGSFPISHLSARQVEPGIWLARNVVIHPTATLIPPVFVGESSRIGSGSKIGPNAVVGQDSVIDRKTMVEDSTVLPGTYCGEGLELNHVIIDRNRLTDVRLGTDVQITDGVILGSVRGQTHPPYLVLMINRILAAICFLLSLPLLGIVALIEKVRGHGPVFSSRMVVRLPATGSPDLWKLFPLYSLGGDSMGGSRIRLLMRDVLPNLLQVAKGNVRLVGVQSRTMDEIQQLPKDWRALYLLSPAGLITEAGVLHGASATSDDIYSSEVYYSAMAGPVYDLRLALRYLAQVVVGA